MKKQLRLACLTAMPIIFIAGIWAATQKFAALAGYNILLGTPVIVIYKVPIFAPYKYFEWYFKFYGLLPDIINSTFSIIQKTLFVAVFLAIGSLLLKEKKLDSHGTAEWATEKDMEKAGMFNSKGVILGVTEKGKYLKHDGPEHVLTMAPTRSGKGVGIIIPTLLTWEHSVVVTDIKGENWAITSGYRQRRGQKVIRFEPTSLKSARFNPFNEIRIRTPQEVADVQNITNILVDPQGKGDLNHWQLSAQSLMVGTILYLKYTEPETASLGRLISFLTSPPSDSAKEDSGDDESSGDIRYVLEIMRLTDHVKEGDDIITQIYGKTGFSSLKHPIICQTATEMLNKADEELASVVSTVTSILAVYRDPVLARNLSCSTFSIKDLMNYETPVSLYLVVPPSDIDRMNPIFRLIVEIVVRRSIEKMEFKDGRPQNAYKHRMLLLLDEFPALGRLDTMERALAYIAGYGLKALLIVQSLNQLNKTYTENNSIIDNCHIRVFFTPNDSKTPELISKMLGKRTDIVYNESKSSREIIGGSRSSNQIGRELMTSGEVSLLKKDEELVFVTGFAPMKVRKILYYEDSNFKKRIFGEPQTSDILNIPVQIKAKEDTPKE